VAPSVTNVQKVPSFCSGKERRVDQVGELTTGALLRQPVAHPLDGDRREINTGDAAGDTLPQEVLSKPRAATPDVENLRSTAQHAENRSTVRIQELANKEIHKDDLKNQGKRSGEHEPRWRGRGAGRGGGGSGRSPSTTHSAPPSRTAGPCEAMTELREIAAPCAVWSGG
jgi:hypothetical protein